MSRGRLRIATRRSALARWQTDHVAARLGALHPGLAIEIVEVTAAGDRFPDLPLGEIGERGIFTKELERALLDGRADIAVHSLKDLETTLPAGLELEAVLERGDPRDAFLSRSGRQLAELAAGARVGTSSARRKAQLLLLRPDLAVTDLRGNVPTRVAALERGEGGIEAIVLARAGLERLGLLDRVTEVLEPERFLPAVGQGALVVEGRTEGGGGSGGGGAGPGSRALVEPLDHLETRQAVTAERAFLRRLQGGCQVPAAALGRLEGGRLVLDGLFCPPDGGPPRRRRAAGRPEEAEALGTQVAEALL